MTLRNSIAKQFTFLVAFLMLSIVVIAQNKVVEEVVEEKSNAYSGLQNCNFKLVSDKGILISYSRINPKKGFSYGPSMVFYDKSLTKKWELVDYSPSEIKKGYFTLYYNAKELREGYLGIENCVVDPSGKFAYNLNYSTSTVNVVNIETGKLTEVKLTKKISIDRRQYPGLPLYSLNTYVDDNYFYMIEGNNFGNKREALKRPYVHIRRIKHGEFTDQTFSIKVKPPYGDNKADDHPDSFVRQWHNFLITNNIAIFKDSYTVKDSKTKQFYRKMAYYPLDDSGEGEEVYVKMGEKVADEDLLGKVMFDELHQRIYTYSMNKDDGKLVLSYRCYSLNMKLIWEKNFDPELGKQVIQKSITDAKLLYNFDNTITITSSYGNDDFVVHMDENGDNPEFSINEKCSQGKIDYKNSYVLNCYEFNKLSRVKGFKSFITKDKSEKENNHVDEVKFFVLGDQVIFVKSISKRLQYKLASFDMP